MYLCKQPESGCPLKLLPPFTTQGQKYLDPWVRIIATNAIRHSHLKLAVPETAFYLDGMMPD